MDKPDILFAVIVMAITYGTIFMFVKSYEAWQDCKRIKRETAEIERQSQAYHTRTMEMIEFAKNLTDTSELSGILHELDITSPDQTAQ